MLIGLLTRYTEIFPEEADQLAPLHEQVANGEALDDRRNWRGHITGSAIVLPPDRSKILLIHHKLFDVWLQSGGHYEQDDPDPLAAAKRETVEETGIKIARYLGLLSDYPLVPLDIDTHPIPARPAKDEPPHFHHDLCYLMLAANETLRHKADEVNAAAWFAFDDPTTARVRRPIEKLFRFGFV